MRRASAFLPITVLVFSVSVHAAEVPDATSLARAWHTNSNKVSSFCATVTFSRQEKARLASNHNLEPLEQSQWPAPSTSLVEWVVDVPTARYKCVVSDPISGRPVFAWSSTHVSKAREARVVQAEPGLASSRYVLPGYEQELPLSSATPMSCPLSLLWMDFSSLGGDLRFGMTPPTGPNQDNVSCVAGRGFEAVGNAVRCQRLSLLVRQVGNDPSFLVPQCIVWLDHEQAFLPRKIQCYLMGKLVQEARDIQWQTVGGVLVPSQGVLECRSSEGVVFMTATMSCRYLAVNPTLTDDAFDVETASEQLLTSQVNDLRQRSWSAQRRAVALTITAILIVLAGTIAIRRPWRSQTKRRDRETLV